MGFVENYQELVNKDRKNFLDFLNNSMNFSSLDGNLQVSILHRDPNTGKSNSSRWMSWWDVREKPWLINKINQRLIGIGEIVYDIDPEEQEDKKLYLLRIKHTIASANKKINGLKLLGVYDTGSRGTHIHFLAPRMSSKTKNERQEIIHLMLTYTKADTMKAYDRTMIALEGAVHWKTGNNKCKWPI